MPFLPTWSVVFLIWCIFLAKYDLAQHAPRPGRWVLSGFALFFIGGFVSISFWSYFFLVWIGLLLSRVYSCLAMGGAPEISSDLAHTNPNSEVRVKCRDAAWFHGQMFVLLLMGTIAAGISCYHKNGALFP